MMMMSIQLVSPITTVSAPTLVALVCLDVANIAIFKMD